MTLYERTSKGVSGKRPRQKTPKNHQKVLKIFSTLLDIFRTGQKASKYFRNVTKIFAWHQLPGPFWGALTLRHFATFCNIFQNRLQWGQSNLVDPAEWPKIGLLNRDFGSMLSVFLWKNSKTQSSLNFFIPDPRTFTKSAFSELAPIRWGLNFVTSHDTPQHLWQFQSLYSVDRNDIKRHYRRVQVDYTHS